MLILKTREYINSSWNCIIVKAPDLSERRDSYNMKNDIYHKRGLNMNFKNKLYTLHVRDHDKKSGIFIKHISVNKLWRFVFLYTLLLIYIVRNYGSGIQEKTLVPTYELYETKVFNLKQIDKKTTYRILAESSTKERESSIAQVDSSIEKDEDWTSNLSEDIIKICNEYKDMVDLLKNKIFLCNLEFDTFLNEMWKKKKTVEAYVPQLLNKHESMDIANAKVLQYYTECSYCDTKLLRLIEAFSHYFTILFYFIEKLQTCDENKKLQIQNNIELYNNFLNFFDPAIQMLIQNRIENLRMTLADSFPLSVDQIIRKEKKIIRRSFHLCSKYAEVLEKFRKCNRSIIPQYITTLYKIERQLASKVPEFYALYKWKKNRPY